MLDLKLIRTETDFVKEKLATRGVDAQEIDDLLALDQKRRDLIVKSETMKANRNTVSDEISQLKRNKEDASDKIEQMKQVSADIKSLDEQLTTIAEDVSDKTSRLPNIPNDEVPVGLTEDGSVELRKWGEIPTFADFKPKSHWEIGEDLGILDFERGAKVSGSRFLYYVGQGHGWNGPFTTSSWMKTKRQALLKSYHRTWSTVSPCSERASSQSLRKTFIR